MRKFDLEMVAGFVPKKHQKLMVHIRKASEKRRRKREEGEEEGAGKRGGEQRARRKPVQR